MCERGGGGGGAGAGAGDEASTGWGKIENERWGSRTLEDRVPTAVAQVPRRRVFGEPDTTDCGACERNKPHIQAPSS